jgi:hypothetical protein
LPAPPRNDNRPGDQQNRHINDQECMGMLVTSHCESVKMHIDKFDLDACLNKVMTIPCAKLHSLTRSLGGRMQLRDS